jgi:hypothetical protein
MGICVCLVSVCLCENTHICVYLCVVCVCMHTCVYFQFERTNITEHNNAYFDTWSLSNPQHPSMGTMHASTAVWKMSQSQTCQVFL